MFHCSYRAKTNNHVELSEITLQNLWNNLMPQNEYDIVFDKRFITILQPTIRHVKNSGWKSRQHKGPAKSMPPERFELSTPGLRDQCSATEL